MESLISRCQGSLCSIILLSIPQCNEGITMLALTRPRVTIGSFAVGFADPLDLGLRPVDELRTTARGKMQAILLSKDTW
jgi:hypothetical protein